MSSSTVGNTVGGSALGGFPGAVLGNQFNRFFGGSGGSGGGAGPPLDLEAFRALLETQNQDISERKGHLAGLFGRLGEFSGDLGGLSDRLGGLGGELSGFNTQLGGIGDTLQGISQGNDPRFAAFQEGQFGLLDSQRAGALRNTGNLLTRSGVTGSVALNEANKVGNQFDLQKRDLAGRLGLKQLDRQDSALLNRAGILNQQAGLTGAQAGLVNQRGGLINQQAGLTAGQAGILDQQTQGGQLTLQNLLAGPTLNIAQLAARNQGQGEGGKK